MQRNIEPMRKQVEVWQRSELSYVTAKWSSTKRLPRERWKLRHTLPEPFTISTRTQVRRISGHVRSGASRMRLPRHSRTSIPSRSSGRRPSWRIPGGSVRTITSGFPNTSATGSKGTWAGLRGRRMWRVWTHDLPIYQRSLPAMSKHCQAGMTDIVQTFDPSQHYGRVGPGSSTT